MKEDLNERKARILQAVVIEYVIGTEPIASDLIASKYDLGVRSATIRNEMAEITDLGFLEQPHTSAGRIPSDQGYRYFVNYLIGPREVPGSDQAKLKDSTSGEETMKELVGETIKTLSRMTRLLSAAVTIRNQEVEVRNVVVTALGPERALLVAVLQNGLVENRIIDCPKELSLSDIGRANEILAQTTAGTSLNVLSKLKLPSTGKVPLDRLLRSIQTSIRSLASDLTRGHLIMEGEEYILAQPEFLRSPESREALLHSMESDETLVHAIESSEAGEITIGRENEHPLENLTVLRRTFTVGGQDAGTLAIIGPTRMNYDRNLALLEFTAVAVSQTLTKLLT
ncbi:MAG: heat-inducible transcriptional repressor HrcA [Fimbriimonadaceae bacterium]|jgi:heat-inducible transcriptional repressor|nr:heat-inducible transcriptional repressor HrcA [Fimbriimonadaceae bacterium]